MKIASLIAAPLIALCTGCASPTHDGRDHGAYDAIVQANRELEARFNRGDMLGVSAMYADDAILLGPGGYRVEGREAVDAYWNKDRVNPKWTLTVIDLEGDESMPIQRGRSVLEFDHDGERRVSVVQFLVLWQLQDDGSYRIAVDAYWPES